MINNMKAKILGILALIILIVGATGCTQQETAIAESFIGEYSDSNFEELKGKESVILFFHADWCVTCVGLEKDINENIDELPEDIKILKVDFDKEAALRKEYGILMQSMFVVLDKDGNVVEKLAAPSFDQLKESIWNI